MVFMNDETSGFDRFGRTGMPAAPPFWELEALIAAGFDLSAALAVMAARRQDNAFWLEKRSSCQADDRASPVAEALVFRLSA